MSRGRCETEFLPPAFPPERSPRRNNGSEHQKPQESQEKKQGSVSSKPLSLPFFQLRFFYPMSFGSFLTSENRLFVRRVRGMGLERLLHRYRQCPQRSGNREWISWTKERNFNVTPLHTTLSMPSTLVGPV